MLDELRRRVPGAGPPAFADGQAGVV